MTWRERADRTANRRTENRPVVHDDRIVWLWHSEQRSTVYAPRHDAWSPLADPFGRSSVRAGAVMASIDGPSGPELVVWGGGALSYYGARSHALTNDGARLDRSGAWRPLSSTRAPSQRGSALHVWTGLELCIFGGFKAGKPVRGGGAWNPMDDTWRRIAPRDLAARVGDSVWNGAELLAWDCAEAGAGHAYDPSADAWRDLAPHPAPTPNARAMVKLGDGVLFVGRDDHAVSDRDGCSTWRYDATANAWHRASPPPIVRGAEPRLVDCDGRIVLGLGPRLFEYLLDRDAWGELPPHEAGASPHLVWVGGELFALDREHTRSTPLSAQPAAVAAPDAPVVIGAQPPRAQLPRGPAVTAVAVSSDAVLAGHVDGAVRRLGGEALRKADGARVVGLAVHADTWVALVGDRLEVRAWPPKPDAKVKRIALDFEANAFAHHADRLVVAGGGKLVAFRWTARTGWLQTASVSAKGTTTSLTLSESTLVRVVLAPEKAKGARAEPRDPIELREADGLKLREQIMAPYMRATTCAVPTATGSIVSGYGYYCSQRFATGKKRRVGELRVDALSRMLTSEDGLWLLGCAIDRRVQLLDLRDDHVELELELFDFEERDELVATAKATPTWAASEDPEHFARAIRAIAIASDGSTFAVGTSGGAVYVIDRDRLGVQAYPATGTSIEWQEARGEVSARLGRGATIEGDPARGTVRAHTADGRSGVLDVASGVWTWGEPPRVENESLARWADVHAVIEDDALVERDVPTRKELRRTPLPSAADSAVVIPAGADRWIVSLAGIPHLVVTTSGRVQPLAGDVAFASRDGVHVALADGQRFVHGWRRWRIHGADGETVRFLELPDHADELAVIPGGALVARERNRVTIRSADGELRRSFVGHGTDVTGFGAATDGAYVVSWDGYGVVRRWRA